MCKSSIRLEAVSAHHLALRPGYARVKSFSSLVLMKCMNDFSPGATLPRAAPPCSRNVISVPKRLTKTNLGFKVITLVSLYFPRASAHDNPTWISSIFCVLEAIDKLASAEGASKLTTCPKVRISLLFQDAHKPWTRSSLRS